MYVNFDRDCLDFIIEVLGLVVGSDGTVTEPGGNVVRSIDGRLLSKKEIAGFVRKDGTLCSVGKDLPSLIQLTDLIRERHNG